jgi:hypothetical protein
MRTSSSVTGDGAEPEPDEPRVRSTRDPPPGRAGDLAEVTLLLVQDRDRVAEAMNDAVVYRLFSAGLALETALGLMGDGPGTANVREAVGELDLTVRDVRGVLFDHHQPDPPSGGAPG